MSEELIILRDLTDEELAELTDEDLYEINFSYEKYGVPVRATVKGLLEECEIDYKGLSDFILDLNVGRCNMANRTDDMVHIYRKDSKLWDNIVINLDEGKDIPDVTVQVQVSDTFIHEEAYNCDGLLIYRT